jgi:hypothetical protein
VTNLQQLQKALSSAKAELSALVTPHLSQSDHEDISDRYQDALEISWYKDELRDNIKRLENEIKAIQNKSLNPFYLTEQEQRNINAYNALPDNHKVTSICYPSDYDGEFGDY